MPTITKYSPGFVETNEDFSLIVHFSNTNELLNIPFVKNFINENFSGFALSGNQLIATYKNNVEWYIVGHLSDPNIVQLPIWKRQKLPCNSINECTFLKNIDECPINYCIRKSNLCIKESKFKLVHNVEFNNEIVKMWFIDNNNFVASKHHKINLENGIVKEAKDIIAGDKIMPINIDVLNNAINTIEAIDTIEKLREFFRQSNSYAYDSIVWSNLNELDEILKNHKEL